jgi:hypothetical protein
MVAGGQTGPLERVGKQSPVGGVALSQCSCFLHVRFRVFSDIPKCLPGASPPLLLFLLQVLAVNADVSS